MSRKVFFSFLGTNDYVDCVYQSASGEKSRVVKYVQSALIESFCCEWTESDIALIFTTDEAIEKNWEQLRIEVQSHIPVKNVPIPTGKNVDEIWEIFKIVFDSIEDGDELHVDITHSFRSIPLLVSSLLQYAKFLKNITVCSISYGAFETLGSAHDVKEKIPNPDDRIAPIFDLTPLSLIQDWSAAANDFICFGSPLQLCKLTHANISPILAETRGQDETARELNRLNIKIMELSLMIKTNRGKDIIAGTVQKDILKILDKLEQKMIAPLDPILKQLEKSVTNIFKEENEIANMLAAVEWCIDKQLIQEGLTLLQEGIVSLVLGNADYCNRDKRTFVSGYLQANKDFDENRNNKLSDETRSELRCRIDNLHHIKELKRDYAAIAATRNDINHAGLKSDALKGERFEKKLKEYYQNVRKFFQKGSEH
ncbi:MAG: TM1812 family CRISPR-associated protein [Planctomycetaceae bacterium]|nr:TM1812 family CRISPR-associated protein [Planctomycetaceae bacterium]